MFSLADQCNISGEVTLTITNFATRWVQSASQDLDVIIASTIPKGWARVHKPVFSGHGCHTLYTERRLSEPEGKLVLCPRRCEADVDFKAGKLNGRFTCRGCGDVCSLPLERSDKSSVLGSRDLVKVAYPRLVHPLAKWSASVAGENDKPLEPQQPTQRKSLIPPPTLTSRSISLPLLTPTSQPSLPASLLPSSTLPPPSTPPSAASLLPRIKLLPPKPPQISTRTNSDPSHINEGRPARSRVHPSHPPPTKRLTSPELQHATNKRKKE